MVLCAKCVARPVPFARRAPLARSGRPVFLPSFLPAAIQPDTPFVHKDDDDRRSVRRFTRNSLPLLLSPSRSPHLAVNVFLGFASALPLSVMLPDDVDGRVALSLFAVIHPCTANSACMNYEMKGGRLGGRDEGDISFPGLWSPVVAGSLDRRRPMECGPNCGNGPIRKPEPHGSGRTHRGG